MNIVEEAYLRLSKEAYCPYSCYILYSGRFKDFGANCRLEGTKLTFKLARSWYGKDKEIQIGCIQELLCKLFNFYPDTKEIYQYNHFIKHVHKGLIKRHAEPLLKESYDRVNKKYFMGIVERPNLKWGRDSYRTFGTYCFKTDTITISKILQNVATEILDYVMFHEMLHKQNKFKKSGRKTYYHDATFNKAEKIYPDQHKIEKQLGVIALKARAKSFFKLN